MAIRQIFRILTPFMLLFLVACAPAPPVDLLDQTFPPSSVLPLNIVITQPLVSFSHEVGHKALKDWNDSPGQRRVLMQCVWQDGLQNMTRMMIPGTTVSSLDESRNPLSAVGSGLVAETDSIGLVHFTMTSQSAIDVARHHHWTHLVVPHDLQYSIDNKEDELILTTPAAIIDVLERRIVWQGTIDSRRVSAKQLGSDGSQKPQLTNYEEATYLFILDLARIMERRLSPAPENRHELARPCQDPPPLLNLPID